MTIFQRILKSKGIITRAFVIKIIVKTNVFYDYLNPLYRRGLQLPCESNSGTIDDLALKIFKVNLVRFVH